MSDMTVSYLLQAKVAGLSDLQMFRNELAQLKQIQSGFKADVGFGQAQQAAIEASTLATREQITAINQLTAALSGQRRASQENAAAESGAARARINDATNYRNTLSLNSRLESQRMNEYRGNLLLNMRLEREGMTQAAQVEAEKMRNYRATMALNMQLSAQRVAAEKAANQAITDAAKASASAFTAGAERTRQALDGIRLTYAQTRAQFDKASGEATTWREQRDAALAYQRSITGVSQALTQLKSSGEATTTQLKAMADMEARLAREQNTLAGGVNRLGISGNFQNALSGAQQLSMFMPGLIGQSLGAASAFQQIASTSGVMGIALGAAGLAVFALGKTFVETSQAFGAFEQGLQGISSVAQDLSGQDMQALGDSFQKLSTELPVTTEQLTGIARNAVLMGVQGVPNIQDFTKSIAELGVATRTNNKSFQDMGQMSEDLAKFLNETGSTAKTFNADMKEVVATLAAVDTVTPGSINSVLNLTKYMASGSVVLNLSRKDIIGVSGALSGLGANAEAGGGAVIRVLMAMNRAAGGNQKALTDMAGAAGISADELANLFNGQVSVRAEAFSRVMGITAGQFKDLVRNHPGQAFQMLADGLARAHESGEDMTATLDSLGLKNVRDIRLVDQLTVGHNLLKVALDASSDSTKNAAALQDRVEKATQNSVDRTVELKNAWTAAAQSFGESSAPAYNIVLDFLTKAAHGAKDWADNLRGVSEELRSFVGISGIDLTKFGEKDQARIKMLVDNIKYLSDKAQNGGLASDEQGRYTSYVRELEKFRLQQTQQPGGSQFIGPLNPAQQAAAGTPSRGFTPEKGSAILRAAQELGVNPNDLAAIISFETGGTFDPAARNPKSSATGLIQFMDGTAKGLGTTTTALAGMTFEQQMEYVVKYFRARSDFKPGAGLGDLYSSVTGSGYKRGSKAYADNAVWDSNHDGVIDRGEAVKSPQFQAHRANYFADFGYGTGTSGSGTTEAEMRAMGQKLFDAYAAGDHSVATIKAINAFKKAHKELWQSIRDDAKKAVDDLRPITAEQIGAAQRLVAAVDRAREKSDPKALDAATSALKRYSDASFSNARAVQSVQGTQTKSNSGQYIANTSEIRKYGDDALKLIKDQEAAQKSGDATRKASADAALAAYVKDSKARASVVELEQAAYTARKQNQAQADQDEKKAQAERDKALKESQGITQALRTQDVQKAQGHYDELKRMRDAAVKDAGDNVSKQLAVQKRFASDLQKGAEAIAQAQYKIDKAEADSGPAQLKDGRLILAKQKRDAALAAARDTEPVDTATQKQTDAVVKQRDAYSTLADKLREHVAAGTLDAATQQELTHQFNLLGVETGKLGLTTEKHVAGARAATFALIGQGQAAYLTAQRLQGMVSGNSEAADSALAVADSLNSVGQRGPAIDLLTGVLSGLMDSAARGEASAESVDKLRAALSGLTGDQATEQQAQEFLGNLDGSIDEQLAAIQTKIEDPSTSDPLRKAILKMTEGFGTDSVVTGSLGDAGREAVTAWVDGAEQRATAEQVRLDRIQQALDFPLAEPSLGRGQLDPSDTVGLNNRRQGNGMPTASGEAAPLPTRVKPKLNPDGTSWVDPGVEARLNDPTERDKAYAAFQVTEAQKVYTDGLKLNTIEELQNQAARARGLKDLVRLPLILAEIDSKQKDATQSARSIRDIQAGSQSNSLEERHNQGLISERAYLAQRQQLAKIAAFAAYSDAVADHQDEATAYAQLQATLTALSEKGVSDRINLQHSELEKFKSDVQGVQQVLSSIFSAFGASSEQQQGISSLFNTVNSGIDAFGKFASGDIVGGVESTIGAVLSLGDAIMALDPGYQLWKKNTLEQASAEQQAMGSKTYGNIANPYYDRLKQDSEALTTKANAGFWQRLGWSLFGGAPETLDKAASDALVKASNIFSDFAQSINGTLESVLIDATDNADFSGVGDALDKQMNKLIQTYALRAIIAKSNLSKYIQQFADDSAAGKDTTADLANIRSEEGRVTSSYQAIAPSLPGYGSNADSNSSGSNASSSTFGSTPSSVGFAVPTGLIESAQQHLAAGNLQVSAAQLYDISTRRFDGSTVRFDGTVARLEARLDAMARGGSSSGLGTLSGR